MSRRDDEQLADILAASAAIATHLERGNINDGLVFDAVRVRLTEIGEAVKAIDPELLAAEPNIPWSTSWRCATTSPTGTSTRRTRSWRQRCWVTCHRSSWRSAPDGSVQVIASGSPVWPRHRLAADSRHQIRRQGILGNLSDSRPRRPSLLPPAEIGVARVLSSSEARARRVRRRRQRPCHLERCGRALKTPHPPAGFGARRP